MKKTAVECHNSMSLLSDADKKYVALYKCLVLSKVWEYLIKSLLFFMP